MFIVCIHTQVHTGDVNLYASLKCGKYNNYITLISGSGPHLPQDTTVMAYTIADIYKKKKFSDKKKIHPSEQKTAKIF